jgi:hypothetical protein
LHFLPSVSVQSNSALHAVPVCSVSAVYMSYHDPEPV